MKSVNIKTIDIPDKDSIRTGQRKYRVSLGWNVKYSFASSKDAKTFLARTNAFYTRKLFELNELYIDLFAQYRRAWWYFDNKIEDNARLNSSVTGISRAMDSIISRCEYTDGAYNVQKSFAGIFADMREVILRLSELHRSRNNWAEMKILDSKAVQLGYIEREITEWKP